MDFSPAVPAYSADAESLGELMGLLRQECSDYLAGRLTFAPADYDPGRGWRRSLPDGRYCVSQFPLGHADTAALLLAGAEAGIGAESGTQRLHFVGFFGRRRVENTPPGIETRMGEVSDALMRQLCNQSDIVLYGYAANPPGAGSSSASPVGDSPVEDYYNLAVIRSEAGGQRWRDFYLHTNEAVINLSPQYYTSVRIHTGVLPQGLDSKELLLKRSVFLDYKDHQRDPSAPIHREEKHWAE